MLESDSDEDEEVRERKRSDLIRGDGTMYLKQSFINGFAFKETVVDYALRSDRNIWQYMYDKDKIEFNCVGENDEEVKGVNGRCMHQFYLKMQSGKSRGL